MADRFTGWLEVFRMDGKVMTLIKTLRNLFPQMGVPVELATDCRPSFTAYDFADCLCLHAARYQYVYTLHLPTNCTYKYDYHVNIHYNTIELHTIISLGLQLSSSLDK